MRFSIRLYLSGSVVYFLAVAWPLNAPPARTAGFFDSFQLLPTVANKPRIKKWKDYSFTKDKFRVQFPFPPELGDEPQNTSAGPMEIREYLVTYSEASLGVTVIDLGTHADGKDPEDVLKNAEKGALDNIHAHLLAEKSFHIDSSPGLAFESETDTYHVTTRIYLRNATMYTVTAVVPLKTASEDVQHFFDSFQFLAAAK
jgi:hypothetical protein